MRLLLLVPEVSSPGGVQSFMKRVWDVMLRLEGREVRLALASVKDSEASLSKSLRVPGDTPVVAASGSYWAFVMRVLLLPPSDAVISGHLGQAVVAWLLKALGFTRRYLVILHGLEAWHRASFIKRLAARNAECVIATTRFTADRFASKNGIDPARLRVIPLCASEEIQVPEAPVLQGAFRILSVGRQSAQEQYKGFDQLIDAAAALLATGRDVTLHLVGDGDDHERLQERARVLGLLDHVRFHGFLDEARLQSAYASCDVFALPSRDEGFGIVFVEAMRHGKACIGARSGGVPEVVEDGVCGLLVPYGDVAALVSALGKLHEHPLLRQELGEEGRRKAQTIFSATAFAMAYAKLLEEFIPIRRVSD